MLGDPPQPGPARRYWKFAWAELAALPAVGAMDYAPKDRGAFRMFAQGKLARPKEIRTPHPDS